jgi:predicted double-glycine peptidase
MPRCLAFLTGLAGAAVLLSAVNRGLGAETRSRPGPSMQTRAPVRDEDRSFRVYPKNALELRTENVVMQQRDYSCGAAALATMIRYHWGDEITELRLLQEVVLMLTPAEMQDRIKNGLSLTDLRRVAVRAGYQAAIGKLTFDKLRESKIPLIVGIIVDDFDHFVVYRGTDGSFVYLADPARGNVRTPIPEFVAQWQKNAVLVVIKRGVEPTKTSPLLVCPEEMFLGEVNRLYLRNTATTRTLPF